MFWRALSSLFTTHSTTQLCYITWKKMTPGTYNFIITTGKWSDLIIWHPKLPLHVCVCLQLKLKITMRSARTLIYFRKSWELTEMSLWVILCLHCLHKIWDLCCMSRAVSYNKGLLHSHMKLCHMQRELQLLFIPLQRSDQLWQWLGASNKTIYEDLFYSHSLFQSSFKIVPERNSYKAESLNGSRVNNKWGGQTTKCDKKPVT